MKVSLVIGGTGQLGKALLERLAAESIRAFATSRSRSRPGMLPLDVTDESQALRLLERVRPDTVYLTAGFTHVDGCEGRPDEAYRVNVMGTRHILEACRRYNAQLVFISTDYVFDGEDGPYREEDPASPVNVYGKTKLEAESLILATAPGALILRTCGLYGYDPDAKNFVMQLMSVLRAGKTMRVPKDQYGTPTLVSDLAAAAFALADKGRSGLFHAAGPDYLNRFEFARKAASLLGLPSESIQPVTTETLGQRARRPLKGGLLTQRIARALPVAFHGVEEGLSLFQERSKVKTS